jgi:hypothetical protein
VRWGERERVRRASRRGRIGSGGAFERGGPWGKGVNGGDRAETFSVGQWRLEGDLAGGGG